MKVYRNAARTKQWIRRAFTELMAEKKDINEITVTELAQRADISKTTLYYHYEDICAVAEEFENELIDQLTDVLSQLQTVTTAEALDFGYYARGIITFLKENEESYRMVLGASPPPTVCGKAHRHPAAAPLSHGDPPAKNRTDPPERRPTV